MPMEALKAECMKSCLALLWLGEGGCALAGKGVCGREFKGSTREACWNCKCQAGRFLVNCASPMLASGRVPHLG